MYFVVQINRKAIQRAKFQRFIWKIIKVMEVKKIKLEETNWTQKEDQNFKQKQEKTVEQWQKSR